MIERGRRFIIWLAMAAFTVTLLLDRHGAAPVGGAVPFFSETADGSAAVTVRICGNVEKPGIYRIAAAEGGGGVNLMAFSAAAATIPGAYRPSPPLRSGEVVEVLEKDGKCVDIMRKEMGAEEKLLLGIPLDVNRMSQADWQCLPGIGPGTAKRLVAYRQINGDFASLADLKRVPGIGDRRMERIRSYFAYP